LVTLGVNAEVVPVVSETSESDDGIQEEKAKTTVCRTWTFASCYRGERQLEFNGRLELPRARVRAVQEEVPGMRSSYQEAEGVEEISVVRSESSICSGSSRIPHRS
jgi:hypothetical protein